MSQSCDLFYEGPQKHHPRALGLDELIGHFPWLLLCASALSIRTSRPFGSPLGRLAACLMRLFVTTPQSMRVISTGATKTHRWVLGSATCSFVIVALRLYYTCNFCIANTCCFLL
jgi:hypothetical protein